MKHSTLAFITAATVLAAVACAKKEHKSPLAKPDPTVDSPAEQDAARAHAVALAAAGGKELTFVGKNNRPALPADATPGKNIPVDYSLTGTFEGTILTLAYPDAANMGWIHLDDEDARAVYNTLRVKTIRTVENKVYAAGTAKTGANIRCFMAAEKKTPNAPQYSCSIYMDYKTGAVQFIPLRLEPDTKVPVLAQKYVGQNVLLEPAGAELNAIDPEKMAQRINSNGTGLLSASGAQLPSAQPTGNIQFSGLDARALFSTLAVEGETKVDERASGTVVEKQGKNVECKKTQLDSEKEAKFSCRLMFRPATGEIATLKHSATAPKSFTPATTSTGSSSTDGKPELNPANGMGSANPAATKAEEKALPFGDEAPPEL